MKNLVLCIVILSISGCMSIDTMSIENSSPGMVTVAGPIFQGCNQNFTNVAQEHCAKFNKNAMFISGQKVPIEGTCYCFYECKR